MDSRTDTESSLDARGKNLWQGAGAAALLTHSEAEALHTIINASSDAIISVDDRGRIQTFSPGAEVIFGFTRQAMEGQGIELLFPLRHRAWFGLKDDIFAQPGIASCTAGLRLLKGLHANGHEIVLEGHIYQVGGDSRTSVLASLRNVTKRVRAEERRQVERLQLSQLARKLMLNEQDNFSRLARAMYDQLGQTLAAIRLTHDAMGAVRGTEESQELVLMDQRLDTLIEQGVRQVRQVLADLCPPLLDENGLEFALDNELFKHNRESAKARVSLNVAVGSERLRWPADVEYAAFMIAREAVGNALRHANARSVALRLCGTLKELKMEIVDDGSGFAAESLAQDGQLGLAAMRERAKAIGAELRVGPGKGSGTRVGLHWQAAA